MAKKESKDKKLEKEIMMKKEPSWLAVDDKEKKRIFDFSEGYKDFLSRCKTERESNKEIISLLKRAGFKDMALAGKLKPGDKVFRDVKGKSILAAKIGKDSSSLNVIGSHIDSPRLDLKPLPLVEEAGFALLKSHYYGGIKKYHWVNIPLAMHGVVITRQGKKIELAIGEKDGDEKFIIPDLLPHLAKDQMSKKPEELVTGEQLSIIVGNMPVNDKDIEQKVKFAVMKHLNQKYGLKEEDFVSAEIEFVPANKPVDIGFDRSMIAAYGQDDRICAYTSLKAFLEVKGQKKTAIIMFSDKEEIGSVGDTGAASRIMYNFITELVRKTGIKKDAREVMDASNAVSADVTAALDPNFRDTHDPTNASMLGGGVSVEKYNGYGGKYSGNDASAEYMQRIRDILEKNKIKWQTGEIGRVDLGGGGTIAMYMSKYGMNCVDIGPCVLGMHAPSELSSKADIYMAYMFYKAFWEN